MRLIFGGIIMGWITAVLIGWGVWTWQHSGNSGGSVLQAERPAEAAPGATAPTADAPAAATAPSTQSPRANRPPAGARERPLAGPRGQRQPRRADGERPGAGRMNPRRPAAEPGTARQPDSPLRPINPELMTPEQVDRIMSFVEKHFPVVHQRLAEAREKDPQQFRQMLRRVGGTLMQMNELRDHDPAVAESIIAEQRAKMASFELLQQYLVAETDQQRQELRRRLREQLARRFDERQKRLQIETENLRQRLEVQSQRLAEQQRNRDRIIDSELDQTLRRLEGGGRPPELGGATTRPAQRVRPPRGDRP